MSLHTPAPDPQASVPAWHGLLVGVHDAPSLQAVQTPELLQTMPVPHDVPADLLVVSVHTDEPVVHAVVPFLHGLLGWQVTPDAHCTHMPVRQTMLVPQFVPSDRFVLLSLHTAVPVPQACVPRWQGALGGTQLVPSVHAMHVPLLQTMLVPQVVPLVALPDSLHTDTPVAHDVVPALHGLLVWQLRPAAHATHAPPLHTRSVPQVVPFITFVTSSTHETLGEQTW